MNDERKVIEQRDHPWRGQIEERSRKGQDMVDSRPAKPEEPAPPGETLPPVVVPNLPK